jgi:hypothetical protein
MSKVSIQLPNSLYKQLHECAHAQGTSVDQLISSAVAEKLAALLSPEYLETRAKRASRKKFEAALKTVPDVEPPEFDRLREQTQQRTATQQGKKRKSGKQLGSSR